MPTHRRRCWAVAFRNTHDAAKFRWPGFLDPLGLEDLPRDGVELVDVPRDGGPEFFLNYREDDAPRDDEATEVSSDDGLDVDAAGFVGYA